MHSEMGPVWQNPIQRTVRIEYSLVRFNTPLNTGLIGHFGDESSQAINYTGTDNKKITN